MCFAGIIQIPAGANNYERRKMMKMFKTTRFMLAGIFIAAILAGCGTLQAQDAEKTEDSVNKNSTALIQPKDGQVINLLTDVSHTYSFNLSHGDRNQNDIYKGVNCLTSLRTISRADLKNINAFVLLMHARLPYLKEDAEHVLKYVKDGGGLYMTINADGDYPDSLNEFLKTFGLEVTMYTTSENKADWGISVHAPSSLVFDIGGRYEKFTSRIGMWADYTGTVGFEVYGDDKPLYKSKVLSTGEREDVEVDISGVKILRLVTNDGGNGNSRDHSVWFDPRFVKADGSKDRVLLKDASSIKVGWARAAQDRHLNGLPLSAVKAADVERQPGDIVPTDHPAAVPGTKLGGGNVTYVKNLLGKGAWQTIYRESDGKPVIFARRIGKGVVFVDLVGVYYMADGQKEPGLTIMNKFLKYMAAGKTVPPIRGGGGWQGSDGYRWDLVKKTKDGLNIHHNEYTKMFLDSDMKAYHETVKYLQEVSGLDTEMKAAQIKELEEQKDKDCVADPIEVDITGVKELTLITTDAGNGNGSDHSI